MMAFQDRALYQIHLGYHGYETPFKCNRCGHLSGSSLEFNLHLYQAKHD
jgi:hunchback-like protein